MINQATTLGWVRPAAIEMKLACSDRCGTRKREGEAVVGPWLVYIDR